MPSHSSSSLSASTCSPSSLIRSPRPLLLLAFSLLLLCSLLPLCSGSSDWSYEGCYEDKPDVQQRALPYVQDQDSAQTVDKCLTQCGERGFAYAGLEYKFECYCSKQPPVYPKVDEGRCNIPCAGKSDDDRQCGGSAVLSVYHNPNVVQPKTTRPLLCLVMIIKNEAHTIMDTLNTVKDHIDCWYILDTGSDDGTQKKITDFFSTYQSPLMKGLVPGKLFEEPFVDYGATRNRILVLAKETGNPLFTLMLSADERVENPQVMRDFLLDMQNAHGTMHGAYPVVMNTGIKFDSIRLARVDSGWRYRARVHEYLAPATGPYVALYRAPRDIDVLFNATDGERRFKSQWFIKKILEEDLERDPNDTRSIYYLARTNSGINNHTAAFYYYDLLAKRSKWDEEVYHGLTMKPIEAKFIDSISWKDRQAMFLDAFSYKPNSMDALHSLAQDHFDSGRFHLAYLFIYRAVHIPPPPGLSVVENVLLRPTQFLYDYEGHRLMGFAAREIGEWEDCVLSFQRVLKAQPNDEIVKGRVTLCEEKLKEQGKPIPSIYAPAKLIERAPVKAPREAEEDEEEEEVEVVKRVHKSTGMKEVVDAFQAPGSVWDSLGYAFSFQFTLNVLGIALLLVGVGVFASKKWCKWKKLKD